MFRRWSIRGCLILLLALCVGVWGLSYVCYFGLAYCRPQPSTPPPPMVDDWAPADDWWRIYSVAPGILAIDYTAEIASYHAGWHARCHLRSRPHDGPWFEYRPRGYGFLGFSVGWFKYTSTTTYWQARVPLWACTVLAALALFIGWRWTRRPTLGGAFPVELAKSPKLSA